MSHIIKTPPKIYLDTRDLIYISDVRKGEQLPEGLSKEDYKRLDEYIKSCCGLIFNPSQTMDWIGGGATTQSISEIAAVIDSAKLKYTLPTTVDLIYTKEVLDQCKEQDPDILMPLPSILQNISDNCTFRSSLAILTNQVPGYTKVELPEEIKKQGGFREEIPVSAVAEWAMRIFKQKQKCPEMYQNRIENVMRRFNYDIEHKEEYFKNPKPHRLDFIKEELKVDKILEHFNPGINVNDIIGKIDIEKCPALNLLWKCHEIRLQQGKPFQRETDVNDYMFIPIVPYADLMLIEKKFKGTIIQADNCLKSKVFSKVSDTLKALESQ